MSHCLFFFLHSAITLQPLVDFGSLMRVYMFCGASKVVVSIVSHASQHSDHVCVNGSDLKDQKKQTM